jgi:hypothetical protein
MRRGTMHFAIGVAAFALFALAERSTAFGASEDDGFEQAAGNQAQHGDLLSPYVVRPAWRVAGVDYYVGRPPGLRMKKPTAQNLPEGAELREAAIYVRGRDVVLDGFDLSGLTVMIEDSAQGVIRIANCEANGGVVIRSTVEAKAHLIVDHCTLDGGGAKSDPNFQTIKVWCPLTVLHSWIKNGPGGIQSGASLVAEYNVLEGFVWVPGEHANAIYVRGTVRPGDRSVISYNTIYSQSSRNGEGFPVGIGAAIAFFGDGGNFYDSLVSHNVLISALPGGASYFVGFYVDAGARATGVVVVDNYYSSINGLNRRRSGAFGFLYPGSRGRVEAKVSGNVDMNATLPAIPRDRAVKRH